MRANYKPNFKNRPPHKVWETGFYFVTARTLEGQHLLRPDKYKQILLDTIHEKTKKFNFPLTAYAILQNHYHLILNVKEPEKFAKLMGEINGASSKHINDADHVIDRKIWWNYFEKLLENEADFYKHLNYIHQNPIKHGISKKFEYDFSSYGSWVKKKGKEYLEDSFRKYPIVDFVAFNDEF